MDQADFQQAEAFTVGDLGDFDWSYAGSDQIASNPLALDQSNGVLPAFEQSPGGDLFLLHTGYQYLARDERFLQNLALYLWQSNNSHHFHRPDLLEQRPVGLAQHNFRLVPFSSTKQAPSAGVAIIRSELSFNLRGETQWSRCPRCWSQNKRVLFFT
jgi:hypothetical protein